MSEILSAGGSLAYAVAGLAGLGLLVTLGLTGLSAMKKRTPLTFWSILPLAVCMLGAIGGWMNAGDALTAVGAASPGDIPDVAAAGVQQAYAVDWISRWAASFLFAAATWGASIGAFMSGEDSLFTPVASVMSGLLGFVGAVVVFLYGSYYGLGMDVAVLAGLIAFVGVGMAVGALKRAIWEEAFRVAGMRFTAGVCAVLAVSTGGRALTMGTHMQAFGPGGIGEPGSDLLTSIGAWATMGPPAATASWIAWCFALGIAFSGFYYELGEVVERYSLIDVWGVLAIAAVLGLIRVVETSRTSGLDEIATNKPAALMFKELGADLPPALLTYDDSPLTVAPSDGGFGDVLHFKDGVWVRAHQWNGDGWYPDGAELESVTLSPMRPLLVMTGGDEAKMLPEMIKGFGGSALLLMRGSEVGKETMIPEELVHLQATFLELTVAESRDFTKELWTKAGAERINWGPTTWYGDEEEEDAVPYTAAVAAEVGAEGGEVGLHVLVEENTRVSDIVRSCLVMITDIVDGEPKRAENRWCKISEGDEEEVRKEVMGVWDVPEPELTKMEFGETPEVVDGDYAVDRISRELGAIDYCVQVAKEEGEEIDGKQDFHLWVQKDGKIYTETTEKSKMQNFVVNYCVKERMKTVIFEVPEEKDWPEPEREGDEAPPQFIEMTLMMK